MGMDIVHQEISALLRKYFPQINELALKEEITKHGRIMTFEAGKVIMNYGGYIRLVPLVVEGSIKVLREDEGGHELFLYYLNPGETCSMSFSCCMTQRKSDIKTISEDKTRLIAIPVEYVDRWMTQYPSWKNFVMNTYDSRMRELIKTIDSIAFQKMDERLLRYLRKKAAVVSSNIITATHQEIALDLNASREAISRLLKQLEKTGIVMLGRNKIELL